VELAAGFPDRLVLTEQYLGPANQLGGTHFEHFGQPEDGSDRGTLKATFQEADEGSIKVAIKAQPLLGEVSGTTNLAEGVTECPFGPIGWVDLFPGTGSQQDDNERMMIIVLRTIVRIPRGR
jgi:hypothetical protein